MSSHSNPTSSSSRNGRTLFPPLSSLGYLDQAPVYGSPPGSHGMAPPVQSHHADIDLNSLNNSRTLPSLSALSNTWESTIFPSGFGDSNYGLSQPKPPQARMSSTNRGTVPNPILQWYTDSDDPWIPPGIPDLSDDRSHARQSRISHHNPLGGQYRQASTSNTEPFFAVPPSDSGYGTRRSIANTSVFSADVPERDQDCQSLAGHVADYQPFRNYNDASQQRDGRASTVWASPASSHFESSGLVCKQCGKSVKTPSEMKKHELRHTKPYICRVDGCTRTDGFSTTNDLDRHTKSKHPLAISETTAVKTFRCLVPGCKSKDKVFPRLDNFRSHLKRMHGDYLKSEKDFEEIVRRGESWARLATARNQPSQRPQPPASAPLAEDATEKGASTTVEEPETDRSSFYTVLIEPAVDLVASQEPPEDNPKDGTSIIGQTIPPPQLQSPTTVQPLEIFGISARVPETRFSLDHVLSNPVARVSHVDRISSSEDKLKPDPTSASIVGTEVQGKAARPSQVSAADKATLTEVIKTVLARTSMPDLATDRITNDLNRSSLPEGKSWACSPNSTSSSGGSQDHKSPADSLPADEESKDLEIQKKAAEVLKVIHDLGFNLQRDTTHPNYCPKIHNAGSAASNKSENQVVCQICQKFRGRPCELKKHMKRHERPYGCTFLTCNKSFGSKNDWKRHENSQHFHLETWRCDEERPEGGVCAKVCYRRQTFHDHLKKEHEMSDFASINLKLGECRIGRNCQARFWCGFCLKLVGLRKKGLEAWNERFDHIDDHFMGRGIHDKRSITDWVPIDSDKSRAGSDSLAEPRSGPSPAARPPSNGGTPSSLAAGSSAATAINLDDSHLAAPKRSRSDDSEPGRRSKHARTSSPRQTVIYCCRCNYAHNPTLDQSCANCADSHVFCPNCISEPARAD